MKGECKAPGGGKTGKSLDCLLVIAVDRIILGGCSIMMALCLLWPRANDPSVILDQPEGQATDSDGYPNHLFIFCVQPASQQLFISFIYLFFNFGMCTVTDISHVESNAIK